MSHLYDFQGLTAWQKSHSFVLDIYKTTKTFPREEKFGLVSQMRRAAISVPASIAEGFKRRGTKDKIHFYNIAQGSLQELRYYILLGSDLGFIEDKHPLWDRADEIGKILNGLIKATQGRMHA